MKLSVQKAHNAYSVLKKRKKMIKERNLHILEMIDIDKFQELYKEYGTGFSEEDFARLFLDINHNNCYYLSFGKVQRTAILRFEYVAPEEIEEIKQLIMQDYEYSEGQGIYYDDVKELYTLYGDRLSLRQFAEKVLHADFHAIEVGHTDRNKPIYIFNELPYDQEVVKRIKKMVIETAGLHIGQKIIKAKFEELYAEYGQELDERTFACQVLEMIRGQWNKLMRGDLQDSSVFPSFIVNPEEIFRLRERVIKEEGLHIDDSLTDEVFQRLYEKYGGMLSKIQFAEEILDVNRYWCKKYACC